MFEVSHKWQLSRKAKPVASILSVFFSPRSILITEIHFAMDPQKTFAASSDKPPAMAV